MSTASSALARLREAADSGRLDPLCAKHGVTVMTAFGSSVGAHASAAHDLDLAVAFDRGCHGDVLALADELASLFGPVDLDLMDLGRASPVARVEALVGCVPLFEKGRGDFARAQITAMLERMDTAWLRRLELELLAE